MAVRGLLKAGLKAPVLVFVQKKNRAAELFCELVQNDANVEAIYANHSQQSRMRAVETFRIGVLVRCRC